jgi:hypothetical protein
MLVCMINDDNAAREAGHFHAVKFYETPQSLCRIVAEFLGEGLLTEQPVLIIATPEHSAGILAEFRSRGVDVDGLLKAGDLLLLDAAETLATMLEDGIPDPDRFNVTMIGALEQLCKGRRDCTVRAYGEMVDVLWKAGHEVAAIRLEMLWNKLAMTHDFSLLCGYAMGNFYKDASLAEIHREHSHVVGGHGLEAKTGRSTIH